MISEFGKTLRIERKKRKLSIQQVANKTNGVVSHGAIKDLERGRSEDPRNGTRAALVRVFPALGETPQHNA